MTPPVPNPPLYPLGVGKAQHWSAENARRAFERARAEFYKNPDSQNNLSLSGAGITNRWYMERLRPGKWSHVMSHFSDADIHQNLTDLMVFVAGTGEIIVDGDIQNRVYGAKQLNGMTVPMIGEFNGQPVVNGKVYPVRPGDWVMIPPNVEHQYTPHKGSGYGYWHITMEEVMYGSAPFETY